MGNSCTREDAVALSETGIRPTQLGRNTSDMRDNRGRWSAVGFEGSVDLDALLEAPSPAILARRRKSRGQAQSERIHRTVSRGSSSSISHPEPGLGLPTSASAGTLGTSQGLTSSRTSAGAQAQPRSDRCGWLRSLFAPSSASSAKSRTRWFRSSKSTSAMDEQREEEEESTYHSYDDPGYMSAENELATLDSDLILASPPESPTVIHARWGEPVDDPDEEEVCTDFKPNPFKLGFCINCQKQHAVNENGDVEATKEYKKIARPTIAKYAANALDNPMAVEHLTPRSHDGDDVDLADLLKQRRDILAKLGRLQAESHPECDCERDPNVKHPDYTNRHTMFLSDASGTNLANLRRMASAGRASQQPQSMRVQRAASERTDRSPASFCGVTKSLSLGNAMLREEEPVCNDWL